MVIEPVARRTALRQECDVILHLPNFCPIPEGEQHRGGISQPWGFGTPLLSRRNVLLGVRESLEETAAVPTRTLGAVGDSFDDLQISSIEAGSSFKVDRLLKIVGGRMVSFSAPTLDDFVFWRVLNEPTLREIAGTPFRIKLY